MTFIIYRVIPGQVTHRVELEARTIDQAQADFYDQFSIDRDENAWTMVRTAEDEQKQNEQHRTIPQCVGCGHCCQGRCNVGVQTFPDDEGQCPALVYDEDAGRHWCKILLEAEEPYKTYMKKLLGCGLAQAHPIGGGCWMANLPA